MGEKTEIDQLAELLQEDWGDLLDCAGTDEDVDGFTFVTDEVLEKKSWHTVERVIVRGPSGRHYAFIWWNPLTEIQEPVPPTTASRPLVTPVRAVVETKTITVTRWVAEENHA
ncbi:hypothetical protein ACFO5K_04100 [Nocardia halotolerans]|uniref:Uncharacterized protein n=1 Tax=Nocardia halotolerans TaxID=1755878 RepID=A0ABV8VBL2_9NOCA